MANWEYNHEKVVDPFNSANICFGRFIGRNYAWALNDSTKNIFTMVPVLPQDHPIDKNWICSDLPAPYQHPLNPPPGASTSLKTFKQWATQKHFQSKDWSFMTAGGKHAANIQGYYGTLKYHMADEFGGPGDNGGILGTNGTITRGSGVATSPGRANSFASPTKGYKEDCIQWVTEIQEPADCIFAMTHISKQGSCWVLPCSGKEPFCHSYYSLDPCPSFGSCDLPGFPCIQYANTHPDYLFGCGYHFPNGGYINPNCESDGQGGHTAIDPDGQPCEPRYICGVVEGLTAGVPREIPVSEMSIQNKCPVWNSKLECTGWSCGLPEGCPKLPNCHDGSGAKCSGKALGNFCGYSSPSGGIDDPSGTIKEWRSNGFLEFPPVHITWDRAPDPDSGFNYCSGKFISESCCIWTENDLGEFAVSGKNWLETTEPFQGGDCGQGTQGIGNIALQYSLLLNSELDNDCNPMCVGRDKRSLVTLPDIKYKGVCTICGCSSRNPDSKSRVCEMMTKEECDQWTGESADIDDILIPEGRTPPLWYFEGIEEEGIDKWSCENPNPLFVCCPTDGPCSAGPCTSFLPTNALPQKPRLAEAIRGKMVCIENLIQDPEFSKESWINSNCEVKEKGWCIPNEIFVEGDDTGITSCAAFKDYYNNKYLGPSAEYPCSWVNNQPATKGAYNFTECRNREPGEKHFCDNCGSGGSIGLFGMVICDNCDAKDAGACCTCMRNYTPNIGGYNAFDGHTFKSACQIMNGLWRENSRCPHGDNQTKLKNHLDIEGYRTHCVGRVSGAPFGNMFGPMTCSPGEEAKENGDCSTSRKPDWFCPDPLMKYGDGASWNYPSWDGCSSLFSDSGGVSTMFTPPFDGSVTNIASGYNFSVALIDNSGDTHKNIIVWGRNPISSLYNPPDIEAESVSAAYYHILAIEKYSHKVFAWGSNSNGECDIPGITLEAKQVIASSGYFIDSGFSIALGMTGQIVVWGTNGFNDTGPNAEYSINKLPLKLPPENKCSAVFAGARCAYAICGSENKLYGWGWGVVKSVIEGPSFEGINNVNTLACISTDESNIDNTHLFVVRGITTTYYDHPGPPDGVSHDINVNRVSYIAGEGFADDNYNPPNNLTISGTISKISIVQISTGYYHVSVLANNGLTLGITQDVYVWTLDNSHGVKDILLANTGTECTGQHPITGCGITNDYSYISSGKWHMTGINNNSGADELPFVSIWGYKNGGFDTTYPAGIACLFAGYILASGITLDETGCGACNDGSIDPSFIQYNEWAIPANPFDPVGYLGLHTKITWLNTCSHIDITGTEEESKTDPGYFNFILNDDGTITSLPGVKHRASGVDGHCRSHIGTFLGHSQQDSSPGGCFQPGSFFQTPGSPPLFAHSRETTYSGPCWPCPQLYDSLGTPEFLYGATHGPEPIEIGNSSYYEFNIKLAGTNATWTPGIWGKLSCEKIEGQNYWINDNQNPDGQAAEDFETSLTSSTSSCCSPSSPAYYDQIKITIPAHKKLACPEIPEGSNLECWRCPAWNIQYNELYPNSLAWDGIHTSELDTDGITYNTGSEKYYNAAQIFAGDAIPWSLPEASVQIPWVGVCTIMHPEEGSASENPSFIGITSGLHLPNGAPNPAAGRTMCWCQSPENRQDNPNGEYGPSVSSKDTDSGGPGCEGCELSVCTLIPYCCEIQWDNECAHSANIACSGCSTRASPQECQNYHALKWCADQYNPGGWTGGETRGLDLFGCDLDYPYIALLPIQDQCTSCRKCDLPLCRHKYNCNLKCPCGTYGMDCALTCQDSIGSYGPFEKITCNDDWPTQIAIR